MVNFVRLIELKLDNVKGFCLFLELYIDIYFIAVMIFKGKSTF